MDKKKKIQIVVKIFEKQGKRKLIRDFDDYLLQESLFDNDAIRLGDIKGILKYLANERKDK